MRLWLSLLKCEMADKKRESFEAFRQQTSQEMANSKNKVVEAYRRHIAKKKQELLECFEQEQQEWRRELAAARDHSKDLDDRLAELKDETGKLEEKERKINQVVEARSKAIQDHKALMADLERRRADGEKAMQAASMDFRRQLMALKNGGEDPGVGTSQQAAASARPSGKETNKILLEKLMEVRRRIASLEQQPRFDDEIARLEVENKLLMEVIQDLKRRKESYKPSHLEELQAELNWLKLEQIDPALADPNQRCDDEI